MNFVVQGLRKLYYDATKRARNRAAAPNGADNFVTDVTEIQLQTRNWSTTAATFTTRWLRLKWQIEEVSYIRSMISDTFVMEIVVVIFQQ